MFSQFLGREILKGPNDWTLEGGGLGRPHDYNGRNSKRSLKIPIKYYLFVIAQKGLFSIIGNRKHY
jgi:hypothetical protein